MNSKEHNYHALIGEIFYQPYIRLEAKGLLACILSMPEDNMQIHDLSQACAVTEKKIKATLSELISAKYVEFKNDNVVLGERIKNMYYHAYGREQQ